MSKTCINCYNSTIADYRDDGECYIVCNKYTDQYLIDTNNMIRGKISYEKYELAETIKCTDWKV